MNVVCGQCGTGYEFDDALVSERGTTVRCMHCGHQFRVHPQRSGSSGPERWIVRKTNGEEYIFRTLSELQKAIAQRRVLITDSLSRDGTRFRRMSELSELESFFSSPSASSGGPGRPGPGQQSAPQDPLDITPTAAISVPAPTPRGGFETAATEAVAMRSSAPALRQSGLTQPTGFVHPRAASAASSPARSAAALPVSPRPLEPKPGPAQPKAPIASPTPARPAPPANAAPPVSSGAFVVSSPTLASEREAGVAAVESRTPVGSLPRRRRGARAPGPVVGDSTLLAAGVSDPSSSHVPGPLAVASEPRSGGPRWIIALVLLGGLALVAGTVGRDYFERFRETNAVVAPTDHRVEAFINSGDELYRTGDLEEARAQYEKASALSDRNPTVLQRLLQVDTTRADADWLRARVLPSTSPQLPAVNASLQERATKVQRRMVAFQEVAAAAPTLDGIAALVDALRVQGQVAAARALVQQASGMGNDASSAYVSAMLDVSDANPNWTSIVSRLKLAVSAERGLGRARAALVYALVGAGQTEEAQQQLEVLASLKQSSPLVGDLRNLLTSADVRASAADPVAPTASLTSPSEATQRVDKANNDGLLRSDDPMADAAAARKAGELSRAARLYSFALSKEPSNVAAMTGLGDVARSQGNTDIALSHYGAALRANPNFGPAVLSCADLKWSTGDRAGAVELYRRLAGGAPSRVAQRIAAYESGSSPSAASESAQPDPNQPAQPAPIKAGAGEPSDPTAPQTPAPEPPAPSPESAQVNP